MKHWICIAPLLLVCCTGIDKTNNSKTYVDCNMTLQVTLPESAVDEFVRELEIDDNARLTMTETENRDVKITVEQCKEIGNSTDDDVVEPSTELVASTI